ncbi:MAG: peptidylprolyl isomerase [Patescibacteria group bacterium]|jgi:parvulin-like peptidyl-prolyl isomerase
MPKKSNLSPVKKAQLKQEIMAALEPKTDRIASEKRSVTESASAKNFALGSIKPKPIYQAKSGLAQLKAAPKSASSIVGQSAIAAIKPPTRVMAVTAKPSVKVKGKSKTAVVAKTKTKPVKVKRMSAKLTKQKSEAKAMKSAKPASVAPAIKVPAIAKVIAKPEKRSFSFGPRVAPDLSWTKPKKEESLESLFKRPTSRSMQPIKEKAFKIGEGAEKKSHRWLKLLIFLFLAVILVLVVDLVGIYRFGFKDWVSVEVAKVLHLPAGQVAGQMISLSDYYSDAKLLDAALAQKREGLDVSLWTQENDKIFYRLAADELMAQELKRYNKPVTDKELNDNLDALIAQAGSREQAESMVQKNWNLNLEQFKDKILKPVMMREYLREAIVNDESLPINQAAKHEAEQVLKLALATTTSSTTDFTALAKQYTDDEAGVNTGGEFGWVVRGQLDPQWEDVLFSAATNTVYKQLVKSRYGYHIVKVESKLKDKTTGKESINLRHILIEVDVDQYIKSLLDKARIVRYIK